ncbi:MAG: O-antigen ligase family protein [Salinivirgaceae bacterium]|nr:O-antigen ligase family protein [Salinivirgaceae bacterium]
MNKTVSKFIETLPCILISAFLLVIPCIWANKSMMDASLLPRQLALSILLVVLLIFCAYYVIRGGRFSFDKTEKVIFGGIALFMLMHIISCVYAINGYEAIFHISKEYMFCLWFFFIYHLLKTQPGARDFLIKTITASSAIFIGFAIAQLTKADFSKYLAATDHRSYYLNQIMETVYSTCSNKNLFASLLFLTLPLAIYNIANFKRHDVFSAIWCCVGSIVAIINLALVVLLLSRTVFAAIAISCIAAYIILCIFYFRIKPKNTGEPTSKRQKLILIAIPAVLLAISVTTATMTETQIEKTIKERISLTINPEKYGYKDNEHGESSVAMRKIIWGKTFEMIKEHPIIGSGPGQWHIVIPKFGVDEFGEILRMGSMTFQRPHNDFLWITAEIGIVGLIGYLVFFIGIIAVGISNISRKQDKSVVAFNILATSAFIGWILISLVDFPHERIEHNIFMLSICAIVLSDHLKQEKETNEASRGKSLSYVLLALCSIIAVGGLTQTLNFYNGEKNASQIHTAYYNQNWKKVLLLTRKAETMTYTINNFSAPILYYKGMAMSMTGNDKDAVSEFKKALEYAPYHIITLNACGTSYMKLEQYDEATEMYERTISISPHNNNALYDLAVLHYNKKEAKEAFEYISKVPIDLKEKPNGFEKAYLSICRRAVLADKDKYNSDKLDIWLKDDNRIFTTIKRMQTENISLEQILIEEIGSND